MRLQLNDVLLLGLKSLLLQLDLVVLTFDGLVERSDGCVLGVLAKSVLLELLNSSHCCFVCLQHPSAQFFQCKDGIDVISGGPFEKAEHDLIRVPLQLKQLPLVVLIDTESNRTNLGV